MNRPGRCTAGALREAARPPEYADFDPSSLYSGLPIARIGKPGEVASHVLFLVSAESVHCTGSEFIVDGGMLAGSTFR
ncbi:hypothetical protein WT21_05070 [Burkholderia territorii]|uniref:SDR family oxidoreductase n=1 Tax=Burkholderia territorii TaxID=1503055 RepID=UPI00075462D1|nr:SDR family oxidoreductase [Burkholderia territorii]KVQ53170.1 hypothetical protein WT21_05070 [Burkholderia territorii]